jgi:hypothetical protein
MSEQVPASPAGWHELGDSPELLAPESLATELPVPELPVPASERPVPEDVEPVPVEALASVEPEDVDDPEGREDPDDAPVPTDPSGAADESEPDPHPARTATERAMGEPRSQRSVMKSVLPTQGYQGLDAAAPVRRFTGDQ